MAYSAAVDHAARYQLLDYANDDSLLWDTRLPLTIFPANGGRIDRHKERPIAELRAELERLLRDGHVELYEASDPHRRVLSVDEALVVAADDWNWEGPRHPRELYEHAIYALSLTESGEEEFQQEYARANPG